MKKIILTTFIVFLFLAVPFQKIFAQSEDNATSAATTAPLDETEMKNVKKIIDLVASNSADQKQTSKIGVIGRVNQKTNTTINLTTLNGEGRIIDIDEITNFSDPDSKSFGISDIKSGDTLGVIGILNKVSSHILGRYVDRLETLPIRFEGVITEVNRKNFQYTAVGEDGNKMILDIQTSSKIFTFTKDDGQLKGGFSKGETGQRVYASGYPDKTVKGQLEVNRLILFPDLALSSKMKKYAPSGDEVTPTPSTKITPTR